MSLSEIYGNDQINKIEAKFELIEQSTINDITTFVGKYPLEPMIKGLRGTYGGESVTQALNAAWETVKGDDMLPHSLHSYFVRAGIPEIPVTWEVTRINDGRNYSNRLVKGYQNGRVMFVLQTQFARDNLKSARQAAGKPATIEWTSAPTSMFDNYKDTVNELIPLSHTRDLLHNRLTPELLNGSGGILPNVVVPDNAFSYDTTGNRTLAFFCKLNDRLHLSQNELKAKVLQLAFILDATYLGLMVASLGVKLQDWPRVKKTLDFFRVSLDHAIYFHDNEYKTDEWLYCEYRFPRMSNDRVLCYVSFYTLDRRLIATVTQEALVYFTPEVERRLNDVNTKL